MLYDVRIEGARMYLVLGAPESLNGSGAESIPCADGQDDLADVDTRNETVGLAESTTHTRLQSIGTSARQHLVDADYMVRVGADAEMEGILSGGLDHVLVGANTGGFEGFGGDLLVLVGDQVDAERELVDVGTLAAEIENANLGVGHTTVEARLGVLRPIVSPTVLFDDFHNLRAFHTLDAEFSESDVPACSCSTCSNGRVGEPS
jgi:hypothetical protein